MSGEKTKRGGGDLKMLRHLWPMVRPLRPLIALGAFLVLLAALAGAALPYATKLAIDRYITPVGPRLTLAPGEEMPDPLRPALADGNLMDTGFGIFYLTPEAARLLDQRQETDLVDSGRLSRTRYYARPLDGGPGSAEMAALAETRPDLVLRQGRLLAVEEKNLTRLPDGPATLWRSAELEGLKRLALVFGLVTVLGFLGEFGQKVVLETAAQKMSLSLRQKVLAHLFSLSQSFFDRHQTARLTSTITNDVTNLANVTKTTVGVFFSDLLTVAVVLGVMFSLDAVLAFITLAFIPAVVLLSSVFGRLSRRVQRALRAQLAVINQRFAETIGGLPIIQAFCRERHNIKIFEELNNQTFRADLRQVKLQALFAPLIDVFASMVLALVIWYGGGRVLAGTMSLGVVAAFIGYARRFFQPISEMAEKINLCQSAFASLERLTGLLDENERIVEIAIPRLPAKPSGGVEFAGVNFRYLPDGPLVLRDINFRIEPGEAAALAGQTGCGKSSIINLMLRAYDPEAGSITFDGRPLKELDLKAHRARLALVAQDVYLYSGTVLENLRLGRDRLSDAHLKAACEAMGADLFIKRLPRGYDEPLGPGGRHLSAGERQLLACARAFIETPDIVILDEATAAVDPESGLFIERALSTLLRGRTSITIAHRLATIRRADHILVLHRGRLIEEGGHRELIGMKGAYYRLALHQGLA